MSSDTIDDLADRILKIAIAIVAALAVAGVVLGIYKMLPETTRWLVIGAFLLTLFMITGLTIGSTRAQKRNERMTAEAEVLQEQLDKNFFTTLVKLNYKYLDKYYFQTQAQAKRSFLLSTFAAVVALGLVVSGIVILYAHPEGASGGADQWSPEKWAGVTATIAGMLSQFIAAVFFYLYNTTVAKMAEYHQKLVLTQNVGLALRITDELKDEPAKLRSQELLVRYLAENINVFLTGIRVGAAPADGKAAL
jgi:hypothetical protein